MPQDTRVAEHTAGPWQVGGGSMKPCHERYVIRDSRGWYLARVDRTVDGTGEVDANARLIAAAPDLLEACRDLIDRWDNRRRGTVEFSVEEARRAVAKAEGAAR